MSLLTKKFGLMSKRHCLSCKVSIEGSHLNTKRCLPCAKVLRKKPIGKLSLEQEFKVYGLMGTMYIHDLAKHIETSKSNLVRWARDQNIKLDGHSYKKDISTEVIKYYEQYGKRKTQERFPEINTRSIIERSGRNNKISFTPRQVRWTSEQKIELVKMSGFVSKEKQAKYFNRPRSNAGSITSAWQKTLKLKSANIKVGFHVVSNYRIKQYLKSTCPTIEISNKNVKSGGYLWHDVNKHLKKNAPQMIKDTARAISEFQEWLYDSKSPRREILKLIRDRG